MFRIKDNNMLLIVNHFHSNRKIYFSNFRLSRFFCRKLTELYQLKVEKANHLESRTHLFIYQTNNNKLLALLIGLKLCQGFTTIISRVFNVPFQLKNQANMSRLVFLTIVAALIGGSWCYSGGAPEEVCDDMTPKHPADPQTSEMPYTVSLSKKAVKAGETVQLTVAGKNPFKGFLLQVRDGDKSVGQFKIDGADKFAKTINCHSGKSVSSP